MKGFYFGLQFSFFRDREGLKVAYKVKLLGCYHERIVILKKNPNWGKGNPEQTPKMDDPIMLAHLPEVKRVEPEDMISGIPQGSKLIEPEDM